MPIRVYELAKELDVGSKELIDALAARRIVVRGPMSTLDDDEAGVVREIFGRPAAETPAPAPEPEKPRVRRASSRAGKAAPPEPAPAPAPAAERPKIRRIASAAQVQQQQEAAAEAAAAAAAAQAAAAAEAQRAAVASAATVTAPAERPRPAEAARAPVQPVRKKEPPKPAEARPEAPREARREVVPRFADRSKAAVPAAGATAPAELPPVELPPVERPSAPVRAAQPERRPGPGATHRRDRRPMPEPTPEPVPQAAVPAGPRFVELAGPLGVGDLAARLSLPAGEVVKRLIERGILAGINQQISEDVGRAVAESFGFTVNAPEREAAPARAVPGITPRRRVEDAAALPRPPVVTVLGHVDHGKTSLLDAIRRSNVAAREFGGITQHIGASVVEHDGRRIVFLDTPGHEAFTTLRARGAQVTDIAVLVVAADDGVMPQTVEAINHAKAADVPIIVAVNKMDLPQANPDRVKQQLAELGLVPEDWGGDTVTVGTSARTGEGIDDLLEMIGLVTDLQELRANPAVPAKGTVIEARLDRGRGPVATVLIQEGTLRVGDAVVAGEVDGRVRAMVDDRGDRATEAGPSTPVEVVGLSDVPRAGDLLEAVQSDRLAKAIAAERTERRRAAEQAGARRASLEEVAPDEVRELRLIIKADVHGSVEALVGSLERLSTPEVPITILHTGVGNISRSDIMLAAADRATVIGFNVRPEAQVREFAEREQVDVRLYQIIYEVVDDVRAMARGMLAPEVVEVILGRAEVRRVFTISRIGTIAGCYVTDGRIVRGAKARLIRDGVVVHDGVIGSLRRFKDDVREVSEGFECGIGFERFNDIKERDVIEAYGSEERPAA